jgi:hypothetical protein
VFPRLRSSLSALLPWQDPQLCGNIRALPYASPSLVWLKFIICIFIIKQMRIFVNNVFIFKKRFKIIFSINLFHFQIPKNEK